MKRRVHVMDIITTYLQKRLNVKSSFLPETRTQIQRMHFPENCIQSFERSFLVRYLPHLILEQ